MQENLEYAKTFARFPFVLGRFMAQRMTLEEARRTVQERMAQREASFLRMLETTIYGNAHSPYLRLLNHAGCEAGDIRAMMRQKGMEGTLATLYAAGVYLSYEEYKGRTPVVRNGLTFQVSPTDLDNHSVRGVFTAETGGSTGRPTPIPMNLEHITARSPYSMIMDEAYGTLGAPVVLWRGIIPDSTLNAVLQTTQTGRHIAHWFSNLGLRDSKYWIKYALATYYIVGCLKLYGAPVPFPQYAAPQEAHVVAEAVVRLLRHDKRCVMHGAISRMLRVCLAANEAGHDLSGLTIISAGEPCTPAKVAAIERTGARFLASYSTAETSTIGFGCARRSEFDDVHISLDQFAVSTHPLRVENFNLTVPVVTLTTLLPSARKIFLNLQMDDYGILEERRCGCPLEQYGYRMHLHTIRSHRKLTGEGVTLIGSDMVRVLEQVLPAAFGGSALDYQLTEQEDARGFTRLILVVHPRVPIEDEKKIIQVVMQALRQAHASTDAARAILEKANSMQIRRAEPTLTARGKFMPLHLQHDSANAISQESPSP